MTAIKTKTKTSARTITAPQATSHASGRSNGKPSPPTIVASNSTARASAGNSVHLAAIIRAHDERGRSDDDVTALVLDALDLTDDSREVLRVAVRMYVNCVRRGVVQRAEQRVFRTFTPGDGVLPASLATVAPMSVDELRRFCREDLELRVPGEPSPIPHELVTSDQWAAKIAAMREKVQADLATIDLYERILSTLSALGARTIADAVGGSNGHR